MINGTLYTGWSRTDITPPAKTLLHGQFHARLSKGIISPLTATVLAVEVRAPDGGSDHAVWISCDLTSDGFQPELVRKIAGRCPGLDPAKMTVNITHTHCAPPLQRGYYPEPENESDYMNPDEYRAWLSDRLADAVTEAWNKRAPGAIRRGFGYAVVGRCRRAVYAGGSARMYGTPDREDFLGLEACDDHAVNFLFTLDAGGQLDGMIVNLACPSQCDEQAYEFSADFWHDVRVAIGQRFGPHVHLLPQCAPAGDASPHLMLDGKEERDLRDRLGVNGKQIIARRIMAALEEAYATGSPAEDRVVFEHEVRTLQLPRLMVSRAQYEMEKKIPHLTPEELQRQPWGFERIWPFGPICDLVQRYEQQDRQPFHPTECHVIRLGDAVFATNPFELFMDYGARVRARGKALQTFLVQLADGSSNGFYLPTERALAGGHYSALIKSNWVGPEAGDMLVNETVASINRLFEGVKYPATR